jgi:hypothetical protein
MPNRSLPVIQHHLVILLVASMAGCLPEDTRPPPRSLEFVAVTAPSDFLPITTLDGWSLTIDTSIVSMGELELDGDKCAAYAESDYLRLLDIGPWAAPSQKLATTYALGTCTFGFGVQSPRQTSVVGVGVTADQVSFMNMPGSDPFAREQSVSLYIEGTATQADVQKRYQWPFRRTIKYSSCGPVEVGASDKLTVEIHLAVSSLFEIATDVAGLHFDPIAAADTHGDDDGFITLDELSRVPYGEGFASLGEYLYLDRLPNVFRVPSVSQCKVGGP